ncbi:CotH kinase family protein [bacterium]|nr:CotH kinase family protein [bacterium]
MLIKQPSLSKAPAVNRRYFLVVGGLILLGLAGYFIKFFAVFAPETTLNVIECGAENIKIVDKKQVFEKNGYLFSNGNTQSSAKAHRGDYSSLLKGEDKYGMLYESNKFIPGDVYRVTVWRHSYKLLLSYLVVNSTGKKMLYLQSQDAIQIDKNGWEQIELMFTVPHDFKTMKIYVTKSGSDDIYFDDLRIEKVTSTNNLPNSRKDTGFVHLNLVLKEKAIRKLEDKRDKARMTGILFSSDDDWVKGSLVTEEETLPVKLRLKGDWLDHLRGKKWSYRVSMRGEKAWNGMVTFSLQNSYVRNHLREWVYHKMLEKEDILTTRYEFATLSLNGEPRGIYAYEEHFEKQLLESRSRREGPIIKFGEEGVWQVRKHELDFNSRDINIEEVLGSFDSAPVKPFKDGKTSKDSTLAGQFKLAQVLLEQFRNGEKPVSEIFDIERLAKYYAILDINKAYHNIVWHNQRFYYNPVISRLEPIGFDGFTEAGIFPSTKLFLGANMTQTDETLLSNMKVNPFLDPEFVRRYNYHLSKYSERSYVEGFLMELAHEISKREEFVKLEFPGYKFEKDLIDHARYIRNLMYPLNETSLLAFTQSKSDEGLSLQVSNWHVLPLEVIGFGPRIDFMATELDTPFFLPGHDRKNRRDFHEISAPKDAKYIFFQLPGIDSVYHSTISSWPLPQVTVPAQDIFNGKHPVSNSLYTVNEKEVTFLPGKHTVDTAVVIPKGYKVTFQPGVHIDFINKAFFLSRSPVFMMGNEDSPISISSSDGTANGFTVLQAGKRSTMGYVLFEGLNTLSQNGWNLTGGVTFYESDVDIQRCSFVGNHCEDGLNLIRLDFNMEKVLVSNTFSDGFDADFCNGTIHNSRFVNTGNDGLDFSGSTITISDCSIENPGDKGLSVGEQATVHVISLVVNNAIVGVASKDLSKLVIDTITLKNCEIGFTAYQKKPEYGGGFIQVKAYEAEDVKFLHRIVTGSKLYLKGKFIKGK